MEQSSAKMGPYGASADAPMEGPGVLPPGMIHGLTPRAILSHWIKVCFHWTFTIHLTWIHGPTTERTDVPKFTK